MRARWVLSCAAGLAILAPTPASAYNWHTHSKMTETAVSILQAPPLALPPPGVSSLEWTQFTTSVAAAPGKLGLLRTGLPTELPDTKLFAPAGDSTAPIELWPFNDDEDTPENEAAQCKYYEDDNLDKIGSIQIKDFRYVPERTAGPCGLKQNLDKDVVLRRVLGWHAGSIDDHYNDTVMWFRPTNAGPASTVKKWLTKIWVAGAGGLALPFKCVWDAIFGDGCDVGSSFDMAKKYNPVEYVDGWIPGYGEVRQGDAATMWHFIHVDGDGAHYNDTRGLLYEEAGPSYPGAIDLMMMAGADLTGLSLKAGASDGDDFYGEYDKISRGDPAWQAYSVGHLEFSPVDNLAQFGWDKRYVAGGKISAAGLAWPLHATSSVTGRVTSLMVRSPVTFQVFPLPSMRVLVKLSLGNFSLSKKSPLRRWPSRFSSLVKMLAVLAQKLTWALLRSSPSSSTSAPNSLKLPVTVLIMRCFTLNWISEWLGSMAHLVVVAVAVSMVVEVVVFWLQRAHHDAPVRSRGDRVRIIASAHPGAGSPRRWGPLRCSAWRCPTRPAHRACPAAGH